MQINSQRRVISQLRAQSKTFMEQEVYKTSLKGWLRFRPAKMTGNTKSKGRKARKHSTCDNRNNTNCDI